MIKSWLWFNLKFAVILMVLMGSFVVFTHFMSLKVSQTAPSGETTVFEKKAQSLDETPKSDFQKYGFRTFLLAVFISSAVFVRSRNRALSKKLSLRNFGIASLIFAGSWYAVIFCLFFVAGRMFLNFGLPQSYVLLCVPLFFFGNFASMILTEKFIQKVSIK